MFIQRPHHYVKWLLVSFLIISLVPLAHSATVHSQDSSPHEKIESDDALVAQTGEWITQPTPSASGGSYLYNNGEAALNLEFSGTALEIIYTSGPTLGTLAIEIDGTVLRTVITTDSETRYGQSAKIDYLTDEPHTLKVYAQAGGTIAVDAFIVSPSLNLEGGPGGEVVLTADTDFGNEPRNPSCDPINSLHRVSRSTSGAEGSGESTTPAISTDGRYVAFQSDATNLVTGDTNGDSDIFVRDRLTCITTRVSITSGGTQGNGESFAPSISGDGRFVAYYSFATNLVTGDTNAVPDVFLRDRQSNVTTRISVATGGVQANGNSLFPTISADGNSIVYASEATNLVAGDTNAFEDVFFYDRFTGTTSRVSISNTEAQATGGSSDYPQISGDGRYVSFRSDATNLVTGDTNANRDLFVRDRTGGTTIRASVSNTEAQHNGGGLSTGRISSNGQWVVFNCDATNLVTGDTNAQTDIFVRDIVNNTTVRASVSSSEVQGDDSSAGGAAISDDGRYVAFGSDASNLVTGDTNANYDVFVRDLTDGTTARYTPNSSNFNALEVNISRDGNYLTFSSGATNLVVGDTNSVIDVFARRRTIALFPGPDTLALFRNDLNYISLIDSQTDNPPAANYLSYAETPPLNGQWLMGDWNGDGQKTPGLYASNGAFYYSNNLGGPSAGAAWTGIWIGLAGRPAVAGRFSNVAPNDCIGAIDSANFPPFGIAFSMYFACNLTGGPTPPLSTHWISVVLPDSSGAVGAHQFVAGDFDNNGVDSIAVRRGAFVAWSNINPTTVASEFSNAQYFGAPSANDYGHFVTGNWNPFTDFIDSFGLFYQNGFFYYRNDLDWNSGAYTLQHVGQPIGSPVIAVTWRQQ